METSGHLVHQGKISNKCLKDFLMKYPQLLQTSANQPETETVRNSQTSKQDMSNQCCTCSQTNFSGGLQVQFSPTRQPAHQNYSCLDMKPSLQKYNLGETCDGQNSMFCSRVLGKIC